MTPCAATTAPGTPAAVAAWGRPRSAAAPTSSRTTSGPARSVTRYVLRLRRPTTRTAFQPRVMLQVLDGGVKFTTRRELNGASALRRCWFARFLARDGDSGAWRRVHRGMGVQRRADGPRCAVPYYEVSRRSMKNSATPSPLTGPGRPLHGDFFGRGVLRGAIVSVQWAVSPRRCWGGLAARCCLTSERAVRVISGGTSSVAPPRRRPHEAPAGCPAAGEVDNGILHSKTRVPRPELGRRFGWIPSGR